MPEDLQHLRRAAVRATLAPSLHNTQPWQLAIAGGELALLADGSSQLRELDPSGRQLLISCGCALMNARVSLATAGYSAVRRLPDPDRPQLLAMIGGPHQDGPLSELAALDPMVELRQTNRRQFAEDDVPDELVDRLVAVAAEEQGLLFPVVRDEHRYAVASLSQRADRQQNADAGYRGELRRWTGVEPGRLDGVPASVTPHVDGSSGDQVPIRDFDTSGDGELPSHTGSLMSQCLLVLGTVSDNRESWLRAGEALERVLLEITRHGYAVSVFSQVIEIPYTRAALRQELGLAMCPQLVLRVGRAQRTPATRRRRLVDVLSESA
ncbi:MAG: nitroreductase [Actinomycetota bacterium]|nr:nitroreductase [Actinomycetota bacterium]